MKSDTLPRRTKKSAYQQQGARGVTASCDVPEHGHSLRKCTATLLLLTDSS